MLTSPTHSLSADTADTADMLSLRATWPPAPTTQRSRRTALSYDPKSKTLAYAAGKVVVLRSVTDTAKSALYTEHLHNVTSVAFAPSGQWIASGDAAGQVRIWALQDDGEFITKGPFAATSSQIVGLSWDFESKRLAAVGDGKERFGHIFMWDSGNGVGEISGHSQQINSVALRPSRPMRAVTVADDGTVGFHEGPPFKFSKSLERHRLEANDVAYSPDSNFFVTVGNDRKIGLYEGKTAEFQGWIEPGHTASIYAVDWMTPTKILTASGDGTLKVVDVTSKEVVKTWKASDDQQVGVVALGESNAVSLNLSGYLFFWSLESDEPEKVIYGHQKGITALNVSDEDVFTGSSDGSVLKWTSDGIASRLPSHEGRVVSITPTLVSAGWDARISSLTGTETKTQLSEQPVQVSAFKDLVVSISESSIETSKKDSVKLSGPGGTVDVSSKYIVAGFGNEAAIYSHSLELVHKFPPHRSAVSCVRQSPDSSLLAVGESGGKITLYKLSGDYAMVTSRWAFHTSRVTSIDWHADGNRVVTASLDTNLYIYRVDTPGRNTKVLGVHKDGATAAVWWGPNKVVSGGAEGAVKVWSVE